MMLQYAENKVLSDRDCKAALNVALVSDKMCVGDTWIINDACPVRKYERYLQDRIFLVRIWLWIEGFHFITEERALF